MSHPALQAVRNANFARPVCDHLVGENHTFIHRAMVGAVVVVAGVVIAKTLGHHDNHVIAVLGDALGYGIHGIGLIPYVEAILAGAASA